MKFFEVDKDGVIVGVLENPTVLEWYWQGQYRKAVPIPENTKAPEKWIGQKVMDLEPGEGRRVGRPRKVTEGRDGN